MAVPQPPLVPLHTKASGHPWYKTSPCWIREWDVIWCSQVLREIIFCYLRNSYVKRVAKARPESPYLPRAVHIGGCDSNAPTLRRPRALPSEHCCLLLPQRPKTKGRNAEFVQTHSVSASTWRQQLHCVTTVFSDICLPTPWSRERIQCSVTTSYSNNMDPWTYSVLLSMHNTILPINILKPLAYLTAPMF